MPSTRWSRESRTFRTGYQSTSYTAPTLGSSRDQATSPFRCENLSRQISLKPTSKWVWFHHFYSGLVFTWLNNVSFSLQGYFRRWTPRLRRQIDRIQRIRPGYFAFNKQSKLNTLKYPLMRKNIISKMSQSMMMIQSVFFFSFPNWCM